MIISFDWMAALRASRMSEVLNIEASQPIPTSFHLEESATFVLFDRLMSAWRQQTKRSNYTRCVSCTEISFSGRITNKQHIVYVILRSQ